MEAHLSGLGCSAPPSGHARWSRRLLANRAVELQLVEAISHESVRRTLKMDFKVYLLAAYVLHSFCLDFLVLPGRR